MAVNPFTVFIFDIFIVSAILLTAYTFNFYYLAILSIRRKDKHQIISLGTPSITIQLPIYNERYVATRLVKSVCEMDYPKDKMKIMVLDDSDDDTVEILSDLVTEYKKKGFDIAHIRRGTRKGYKAGALKFAMNLTDTEYVAIFDADFIPPSWFLKKAIPYFTKPEIGLVQCRWGHVNENYSAITQAQALSLDFHFLIEQKAKSNSHLFMNFNGTAGIWRTECIENAGGWHTSTLVEDLDLSYRAQMKGWKCLFISDIVVEAELPVQMNAAKRQQFRWAKGAIQCAIKLLGDILIKRKIPFETKIQAFVQLTRHFAYPLLLIQFLALPILLASNVNLYIVKYVPAITIATYFAMGPAAYLLVIYNLWGKDWKQKAKVLPFLLIYSAGMAVNNTIAVFDALFGKKNEFLRTPKYGIINKSDDWRNKAYNLPFTKTTLLELFFGVYGIIGILVAIFSKNAMFAPIIAIPTIGFCYVAYLSLSHSKSKRIKSTRQRSKTEKMADNYYKLAVIGMFAIILFGGYMAFNGYYKDVYPLDLSRGLLDRIAGGNEPLLMIDDLRKIKTLLPQDGNPVWIFPTDTTNFERLQKDVDSMIKSVESIKNEPANSEEFNTAMFDIHFRAIQLRLNLMDATPYMYASFSNIVFTSIWIAAILGVFTMLKRKKEHLKSYDKSEDV
ncbi:MAG TPA: cellulose synthase family protein [Candidatus Nitrosotenuis sp.]|jgi:cellulose synthase/poly-beta-1,6-N-acetylglucosamine synthase-like glycosyltransferase